MTSFTSRSRVFMWRHCEFVHSKVLWFLNLLVSFSRNVLLKKRTTKNSKNHLTSTKIPERLYNGGGVNPKREVIKRVRFPFTLMFSSIQDINQAKELRKIHYRYTKLRGNINSYTVVGLNISNFCTLFWTTTQANSVWQM